MTELLIQKIQYDITAKTEIYSMTELLKQKIQYDRTAKTENTV